MNFENLRLSLFQNSQAVNSKAVTIQEIIRLIKFDDTVRDKQALYDDLCARVTEKYAKEKVKDASMPTFSVACCFKDCGKQLQHIKYVTGLGFCDIDDVDESKMSDVRRTMVADPHTLMLYTTISHKGFRVLFCYTDEQGLPPANGELYAAAYRKGNQHFAELCGMPYDAQCGNLNRLSGLAHDPDVYVNLEAVPFIVSDAEAAEANLDPSTEPGKRRTDYPTGTYEASADAAWAVVEPMLTRRDLSYGPGSHHQYVMHAAFLFNRFGTSLSEFKDWASQWWGDYSKEERESVIDWVYDKRSSEHGIWRLNKRGRKGEVSMITLPEICTWLSSHQVEVIYNLVTDIILYRTPRTSADNAQSSAWLEMDEGAVCTLRREMAAETGKRILKSDLLDIIRSNYAKRIHPVRDYLTALPPWDGKDRVRELAAHLTAEPVQEGQNAEQAQEELLWAFHKWLVACVATWLSDDMSNHSIFVLIGPQGIYKTTFFRYLLPPELRSYFWENAHNSFSNKDDHIALTENCLVEIEEIDMFKDKDNAELKALSTAIKIKVRRPYGRFMMEKHRLVSFCATGNQEKFLSDETGNRRWLCFLVSQIDDPRGWDIDYGQLYAQLRDEYHADFHHWFSQEDQKRVERQNDYFRIVSDEEQLIRHRFRKPRKGESFMFLNAATIAQMISCGSRQITSRRVSLVMKAMGYKSERNSQGCYYRLYNMDPGEAQREISARFDDEAEEAVQASKPTQPEQTNIPFERYNDEDENNNLPF